MTVNAIVIRHRWSGLLDVREGSLVNLIQAMNHCENQPDCDFRRGYVCSEGMWTYGKDDVAFSLVMTPLLCHVE